MTIENKYHTNNYHVLVYTTNYYNALSLPESASIRATDGPLESERGGARRARSRHALCRSVVVLCYTAIVILRPGVGVVGDPLIFVDESRPPHLAAPFRRRRVGEVGSALADPKLGVSERGHHIPDPSLGSKAKCPREIQSLRLRAPER